MGQTVIETWANLNKTGEHEKWVRENIVLASDVEQRQISWLWKPYLPKGKITLLRGDPGVGKTMLAMEFAAIVSSGRYFPGQVSELAPNAGEVGKKAFYSARSRTVLILSAEDDLDDTLVPRLAKAGANLDFIAFAKDQAISDLTFTDPRFIALCKLAAPDLVIVDPIQAFMGSRVDLHRANEVRPVMSHLRELARALHCPIVLIEHLNKQPGGKGLYRGLGSIDVTAAARSIIMVGRDEENPDIRGFAHIKGNTSQEGKVVGFTIDEEKGFEWDLNTHLTRAMIEGAITKGAAKAANTALADAKDFLLNFLANGKQTSKDVFNTAKTHGIAEKTLKRAKTALNIDTSEAAGFGRDYLKYWQLPQE